jgi:hypothetical protein
VFDTDLPTLREWSYAGLDLVKRGSLSLRARGMPLRARRSAPRIMRRFATDTLKLGDDVAQCGGRGQQHRLVRWRRWDLAHAGPAQVI